MPEFKYKGKLYYNPVEFVLDWIGGAWKMPILWRLREKTLRYSEIKKSLTHISDKMLAQSLRELEENGLVNRKVYAVVPPHTEYSLTDLGKKTIPMIMSLRELGITFMKTSGAYTEDLESFPIAKPTKKNR
ncbi:winged helix-turn-helix transcriptional regulator [Leptospira levettii]|uniref:winged helix-turn-helix transcriptional regulator n=1 Tax=Leptospira levettii TaxID=2023178 RepID=UPI001082BBE0|nr:helix-turn-helix domain-containing protein [Leptospira levettii]TGL01069.1 transcriptional regulator [Leptospira levettii]TGM91505.1 transcriptional regulator [Leptospira levettii]